MIKKKKDTEKEKTKKNTQKEKMKKVGGTDRLLLYVHRIYEVIKN